MLSLVNDMSRTYKIYYVCGNESITINNLIQFLKDEMGIKEHSVVDSEDALFPNQIFEFDNSDIKKDYGIEFTNLKSGIKDYMKDINEY